jgi:Zn-dependent protease with chaperone function
VIVPTPSARALEFHRTGNVLWLFARVWDLAVPAAILATGLSSRLRTFALGWARARPLATSLFGVLYLLLTFVIDLPIAFYAGFLRAHDYGLSNQSLIHWLANQLKALGVSLGLVACLLWVPYAIMRRYPRAWWAITAALNVPLVVSLVYLVPLYYDPLFNQFGPMRDKELEGQILALADRAGIAESRVFEVDKSRDTNTVNAYVTGLGGSSRIVLWDTLLEKLEVDEVLVVMGHEMGHFVLGHVLVSVVLSCALAAIGLFLIDRLGRFAIERWGRLWGIQALDDVASLPLLFLLASVLSLAGSPLICAYSRHQELEADRFAVELTRDNRAGAEGFVKLMDENLGVPWPSPLYALFRATHPSAGERIRFFNTYRPWATGAPERYAHLFREGEEGDESPSTSEPAPPNHAEVSPSLRNRVEGSEHATVGVD